MSHQTRGTSGASKHAGQVMNHDVKSPVKSSFR